jgi:hypothetical protein
MYGAIVATPVLKTEMYHCCPTNSLSLREQGRTVCTAGVEFHVPAWLIACKVVQSESLADSSADLYGTVVAMFSSVVRIALRQHLPMSTGIENPEHSFEYLAGKCRLASRTTGRNMFLRKMFPDSIPLFIA